MAAVQRRRRHEGVAAYLCLLVSLVASATARSEDLHIAVAANFTEAMHRLTDAFEADYGYRATVSSGSSGRLYAQIRNGAPYHLFFSADQEKPAALEQDGLAVAESRFTYVLGRLVLWSNKPGFVDNEATRLKSGDFNKLALANPKLAPYGVAAVEVLEQLELEDSTRSRWVRGENVAQAFQFVLSGNADLGFAALSQAKARPAGSVGSMWVVPGKLHNPIRQDVVLLKAGAGNPAARAFLAFMRQDKAQAVLRELGYDIPTAVL